MVADGKFRDAVADGDDLARAVRHGNAGNDRAPHAADDGVVVIVERVRAKAHGDFAGARFWRFAFADDDAVEAAARLHDDGLGHGLGLHRLGLGECQDFR